jgi:hypothetical protein
MLQARFSSLAAAHLGRYDCLYIHTSPMMGAMQAGAMNIPYPLLGKINSTKMSGIAGRPT